MKYTFLKDNGKTKTVEIDDTWIKKQKINLGLTTQEAVDMWLFDNGYVDNDVVDELTSRAQENAGKRSRVETGKRKPQQRKPDMIKRDIISLIYETLADCDLDLEDAGKLENVRVMNIERIVAFECKDNTYEITLSKKRKPKD